MCCGKKKRLVWESGVERETNLDSDIAYADGDVDNCVSPKSSHWERKIKKPITDHRRELVGGEIISQHNRKEDSLKKNQAEKWCQERAPDPVGKGGGIATGIIPGKRHAYRARRGAQSKNQQGKKEARP